jgi:hypothetical protein
MRESGSRFPLVLTALAVLLLVAVVAVAATGSTPTGTTAGRRPSDVLFDTVFSLALVMLIPAAVLLVYGLMQRKEVAREMASARQHRMSLPALLVFMAVFSAIVYFRAQDLDLVFGGEEEGGVLGPEGAVDVPEAGADDPSTYQAEFAWIPVLVVLGLAAIGVAAYVLAARRQQAPEQPHALAAAEVADALEETLDDLRAEPDARRAVIAAYARLERSLAAAGLPRRRAETAGEYVPRILVSLEVDGAAVRRLTALFADAKFSDHAVGEPQKLEAIDALERIRDDLRELARRTAEDEVELADPAAAR